MWGPAHAQIIMTLLVLPSTPRRATLTPRGDATLTPRGDAMTLTPPGEKGYLDVVSRRALLSEWAPRSPRYSNSARHGRIHQQHAANEPDSICSICLEPFREQVDTLCGHSFCSVCIATVLTTPRGASQHTPCPVCRAPFYLHDLRVHATGRPLAVMPFAAEPEL